MAGAADDMSAASSDDETEENNDSGLLPPTPPPQPKSRATAKATKPSAAVEPVELKSAPELGQNILATLRSPQTYQVTEQPHHFVVEKCDVFSVMQDVVCDVGSGKRVLGDLERVMRLLALILCPRMNLLALANEAAKARIDTDFANANVNSCSLSAVMWAFEKSDDSENETWKQKPIVQEQQLAKSSTWPNV